MFGPPSDVKGQCNARLYLADDWGDNRLTLRCQLSLGHANPHEERFVKFLQGLKGKVTENAVTVQWTADERAVEHAAEA